MTIFALNLYYMTNQELLTNRELTAPDAPTNLRTVANYATSTLIAWEPALTATSYEVWVTDSAGGAPTVKAVVKTTAHTISQLLPNHSYHIQVYSVLDTGDEHLMSPTAAEKNTSTDFIIVEDILDCPPHDELGSICPLVCERATVETPNIVAWSAFSTRDFHKIRIKNQSGTIMAQIVLERNIIGGVLHVRNFEDLICDNTQLAVNPPDSSRCPSGMPPLSFCGSFPVGTSTVNYCVSADINQCVVAILSPASQSNYVIEAERCTPPQNH